jgi:hypothetical protein
MPPLYGNGHQNGADSVARMSTAPALPDETGPHVKALASCIARSAYRVLTSSLTRSHSGLPGGRHFLRGGGGQPAEASQKQVHT